MKGAYIVILTMVFTTQIIGQKYTGKFYTSKGTVSFFSEAPLENIEASSNQLKASLDGSSGKLMFRLPIESFQLDKKLMQKHFNEQYMESGKYPEARFEGEIKNWSGSLIKETEVNFQGELTIHGVTHQISEKAILTPENNNLSGKSKIQVRLKDYGIKIPRMIVKNIAEEVDITIDVMFNKL